MSILTRRGLKNIKTAILACLYYKSLYGVSLPLNEIIFDICGSSYSPSYSLLLNTIITTVSRKKPRCNFIHLVSKPITFFQRTFHRIQYELHSNSTYYVFYSFYVNTVGRKLSWRKLYKAWLYSQTVTRGLEPIFKS